MMKIILVIGISKIHHFINFVFDVKTFIGVSDFVIYKLCICNNMLEADNAMH
jgi:hypothetical protein